jgi:hypothetical protein
LDYTGFRGGLGVRHPIDIVVMFLALWLLGSMVVDILTPKELTVYLIAAATGPAAFGTAICYFLRVPKVDFAMIVTALWLVASMAIELVSPVPLPDYMIPGALIPPMIVGAALHWHRYRLRRPMQTQKRPAVDPGKSH